MRKIIAAALTAPAVVLGINRTTRAAARKFLGPEGLLAGRSLAGGADDL